MKGRRKNTARSVLDRLRTLANREGHDYNHVLIRYVLERLLYRLSKSSQRDCFALKGGMLLATWMTDPARMTMDIDLLAFGDAHADALQDAFRIIMGISVPDDGVLFAPDSVNVEPVREAQLYPGFRINAHASIGKILVKFHIDIGFGDAVTPGLENQKCPTLLDAPAPQLKAYPRETVVAEKLKATVDFGMRNSRMKDYYDLFFLSHHFDFDGQTLSQAIQATFERHKTEIPNKVPPGLSQDFGVDTDAMGRWDGFVQKTHLLIAPSSLASVVKDIENFIMPPTIAAASRDTFTQKWNSVDQLWSEL